MSPNGSSSGAESFFDPIDNAEALSLEFEHGLTSVYLARAKLRVSANKAYSDSYSDYSIGFWHDEAIKPGKTTMPYPDYLVKIWEKHGRGGDSVSDFSSDLQKRLVWLSADLTYDGDVAVCTFVLDTPTIQASIKNLDCLASQIDTPPSDLFWAGVLALCRLDFWARLSASETPQATAIRFQLASNRAPSPDVRVIFTRELGQ